MRTPTKHNYSTPEDLLAKQEKSELQKVNEAAATQQVPIEVIREAQDAARDGATVRTDKFVPGIRLEPI